MGTLVKTLALSAAKKAARIDPQDFITQDNITTAIKLASHVVKLFF